WCENCPLAVPPSEDSSIVMNRGLEVILKLLLGAVSASIIAYANAGPSTAAGVWKQIDENGKAGAPVTITEEGGVFVGRLSRLFLDAGDDPNPICSKCPGEKHNQPILGLVFIEGMKRSGLDYAGGTLLDHATGDAYTSTRA